MDYCCDDIDGYVPMDVYRDSFFDCEEVDIMALASLLLLFSFRGFGFAQEIYEE